jgi:hypothetical protein
MTVLVGTYLGGGGIADQGDDDPWFGKGPASRALGANGFETQPGPEMVQPSVST